MTAKDKIIDWISQGDHDKVVSGVLEVTRLWSDTSFSKEAILQVGRYRTLQKERRLGKIENDAYFHQANNFFSAIQELIDSIPESLIFAEDFYTPPQLPAGALANDSGSHQPSETEAPPSSLIEILINDYADNSPGFTTIEEHLDALIRVTEEFFIPNEILPKHLKSLVKSTSNLLRLSKQKNMLVVYNSTKDIVSELSRIEAQKIPKRDKLMNRYLLDLPDQFSKLKNEMK